RRRRFLREVRRRCRQQLSLPPLVVARRGDVGGGRGTHPGGLWALAVAGRVGRGVGGSLGVGGGVRLGALAVLGGTELVQFGLSPAGLLGICERPLLGQLSFAEGLFGFDAVAGGVGDFADRLHALFGELACFFQDLF